MLVEAAIMLDRHGISLSLYMCLGYSTSTFCPCEGESQTQNDAASNCQGFKLGRALSDVEAKFCALR